MISETDRGKSEQKINQILDNMGEWITGAADVIGDAEPSFLFKLFAGRLSYLLSGDPKKVLSERAMHRRKRINPFIKLIGPAFLEHKQIIESKNRLLGIDKPDRPLNLPKESVIWCPNHGFKDDILASVMVSRHAYILFGSLPMFYNTFDGLSAFINGVVLCNRKVSASRRISMENAEKVLSMGTDLMLFPEGVWNKTPDKLILNLWPGAYRIAKDTGSKIVPIIHYLPDPHKKYKENVIHTVIADPISMDGLSEEEGLTLLRDTMATWYYLLMERYGKSTRKDLLSGYKNADEAWEDYLRMHTGEVPYYDKSIERTADYRPRNIHLKQDVYKTIAEIKDITDNNIWAVEEAVRICEQGESTDFQRKF